jgi:hypothetical protein
LPADLHVAAYDGNLDHDPEDDVGNPWKVLVAVFSQMLSSHNTQPPQNKYSFLFFLDELLGFIQLEL